MKKSELRQIIKEIITEIKTEIDHESEKISRQRATAALDKFKDSVKTLPEELRRLGIDI